MTSRIVVLVVCIAAAIATDVYAQVRAGLNEVNFTATVSGTTVEEGDTETGFTFTGAYGRFLTDRVEVGPLLAFVKAEGTDAFGTISGFATYHFVPDSNVVPFVGAQLGTSFGLATDFSDNPWSYGFFGGIKAFIGNGGGAITIQPFWTRQNIGSPIIDETTQVDNFGATAGISIFF
jgi:hypothetical protein